MIDRRRVTRFTIDLIGVVEADVAPAAGAVAVAALPGVVPRETMAADAAAKRVVIQAAVGPARRRVTVAALAAVVILLRVTGCAVGHARMIDGNRGEVGRRMTAAAGPRIVRRRRFVAICTGRRCIVHVSNLLPALGRVASTAGRGVGVGRPDLRGVAIGALPVIGMVEAVGDPGVDHVAAVALALVMAGPRLAGRRLEAVALGAIDEVGVVEGDGRPVVDDVAVDAVALVMGFDIRGARAHLVARTQQREDQRLGPALRRMAGRALSRRAARRRLDGVAIITGCGRRMVERRDVPVTGVAMARGAGRHVVTGQLVAGMAGAALQHADVVKTIGRPIDGGMAGVAVAREMARVEQGRVCFSGHELDRDLINGLDPHRAQRMTIHADARRSHVNAVRMAGVAEHSLMPAGQRIAAVVDQLLQKGDNLGSDGGRRPGAGRYRGDFHRGQGDPNLFYSGGQRARRRRGLKGRDDRLSLFQQGREAGNQRLPRESRYPIQAQHGVAEGSVQTSHGGGFLLRLNRRQFIQAPLGQIQCERGLPGIGRGQP